jgi:hypothetical protein
MTRRLLARALGLLLAALGLTLLWNALGEFRHAVAVLSYAVPVLQLLSAPLALLGGYRLWRGDRRALVLIAVALGLATAAGALAAWIYSVPAERSAAAFGALGGGIVFAMAVVLLASIALRTPETASVPAED